MHRALLSWLHGNDRWGKPGRMGRTPRAAKQIAALNQRQHRRRRNDREHPAYDDEPQRRMISYRAGNAHTPADILVGAKEDEQMHRRATTVRDFYRHHTYTDVPDADHELWHPNYLQAIATALDRLKARPAKPTA